MKRVVLAVLMAAFAAPVSAYVDFDGSATPAPVVGYMSDKDYARLDDAPMKEFNYALLDRFIRERTARQARLSPVGDEIAYWANKQRGTKIGLNIADLRGVTGQYMACKSVALAYASNLDEYFAILSLIQFEDGCISWTHHNRDIGGQLIEANGWIWRDVTEEILANLGPEAEGAMWTILKPRERAQRAVDKGERPEFYRKAGLGGVKEEEPYQSKFIMGGCSRAGYEFPVDMLKSGDILVGIGAQPMTAEAERLAAEWKLDTDVARFALTHSVGVVIENGDECEIATMFGSSLSFAPIGSFVLGGKGNSTIGAKVLRPTPDVSVVLAKARKFLDEMPARPDWGWLDSKAGDDAMVENGRVYHVDANGAWAKRKSTLDLRLNELWFYLDQARLGPYLAKRGVVFESAKSVSGKAN